MCGKSRQNFGLLTVYNLGRGQSKVRPNSYVQFSTEHLTYFAGGVTQLARRIVSGANKHTLGGGSEVSANT